MCKLYNKLFACHVTSGYVRHYFLLSTNDHEDKFWSVTLSRPPAIPAGGGIAPCCRLPTGINQKKKKLQLQSQQIPKEDEEEELRYNNRRPKKKLASLC